MREKPIGEEGQGVRRKLVVTRNQIPRLGEENGQLGVLGRPEGMEGHRDRIPAYGLRFRYVGDGRRNRNRRYPNIHRRLGGRDFHILSCILGELAVVEKGERGLDLASIPSD